MYVLCSLRLRFEGIFGLGGCTNTQNYGYLRKGLGFAYLFMLIEENDIPHDCGKV